MRSIGAVIFPGFELLDLFGPMEMFGLLSDDFNLHLVSEQKGAVQSGVGISATATLSTRDCPDFDILFVPGGPGTRTEVDNTPLLAWIAERAKRAEYVLSVCTGSALLAKAGLLDGLRATTNKAAWDWATAQGPKVDWVRQARWVEDGRFITSSGVSAGMDMSLGAISLMLGVDRAEEVAKWTEYLWNSNPDNDPFVTIHENL